MEEQLANQIGQPLDPRFLEKFSRVRIKDGTRFDLPERLKNKFPGFGGKVTSDAAACIQFEFDLKNGNVLDIDITSAKRTDYQDAKEKTWDIKKGDLIIRDLGYFSSKVLLSIIKSEAFFVSRLKQKITVFDQALNEVSFSRLYTKMVKNKLSSMKMDVFIGEKEKVPVRLIIDLIPEEVYQARIRKTEKENKKKGCQTSEEYKTRARFNLIITNVSENDLPNKQVYMLYKTRWQIELIFKIWKSTLGINKIHPMNYHRLMCLLYAKLILILINSQIINMISYKFYKSMKKMLSVTKSMKTLMTYFYKTRKTLKTSRASITSYMHDMVKMLSVNHWLEKRKNRANFIEIFDLFCCISEK
jgi:transposase